MNSIRNWYHKKRLNSLLVRLKTSGYSPRNLEICPFGNWFVTSVYDRIGSPIISESVSGGFSDSASLSLLKAVVENIERKAFEAGQKIGIPSCQTDRSDGFAAYPVYFGQHWHAAKKARENAYLEAVERYLWANWWDDVSIGHRISDITSNDKILPATLHSILRKHIAVKQVFLVEPCVVSSQRGSVAILVVQLQGGGFISGGAGFRIGHEGENAALVRAFGELLRKSSVCTINGYL